MSTQIVNPNKFRKILYSAPRRRKIFLQVEASVPVDVYIVDAEDMNGWKSGRDYAGKSFRPGRLVQEEIRLPSDVGDEFYLVIENPSENPAAVHYEIYDA